MDMLAAVAPLGTMDVTELEDVLLTAIYANLIVRRGGSLGLPGSCGAEQTNAAFCLILLCSGPHEDLTSDAHCIILTGCI